MDRGELEALDRESLVVKAQAAGIRRARILTRPELIDELLRLVPGVDEAELKKARGFFGKARDLVARVVERGLHLPDAADRIRSLGTPIVPAVRLEADVLPTVTLAEIYAAQGHPARAIETLKRVLEREPEHAAARALLARLSDAEYVAPEPALPPEAEPVTVFLGPEDDASEVSQTSIEEPMSLDGRSLAQIGEFDESGESPTVSRPKIAAPSTPTLPGAAPVVSGASDCLAVPIARGTLYVTWKIGRDDRPRVDGTLVLRAVVVTADWDGPRKEVIDLPCEGLEGETTVSAGSADGRSVVRVAVGIVRGDAFEPLAHSPMLEWATRMRRGPASLMRWTLKGPVPVALDEARAAKVAGALERSRAAAS